MSDWVCVGGPADFILPGGGMEIMFALRVIGFGYMRVWTVKGRLKERKVVWLPRLGHLNADMGRMNKNRCIAVFVMPKRAVRQAVETRGASVSHGVLSFG